MRIRYKWMSYVNVYWWMHKYLCKWFPWKWNSSSTITVSKPWIFTSAAWGAWDRSPQANVSSLKRKGGVCDLCSGWMSASSTLMGVHRRGSILGVHSGVDVIRASCVPPPGASSPSSVVMERLGVGLRGWGWGVGALGLVGGGGRRGGRIY